MLTVSHVGEHIDEVADLRRSALRLRQADDNKAAATRCECGDRSQSQIASVAEPSRPRRAQPPARTAADDHQPAAGQRWRRYDPRRSRVRSPPRRTDRLAARGDALWRRSAAIAALRAPRRASRSVIFPRGLRSALRACGRGTCCSPSARTTRTFFKASLPNLVSTVLERRLAM